VASRGPPAHCRRPYRLLGSRDHECGHLAAEQLSARTVHLDVTDDASVDAAVTAIEADGRWTCWSTMPASHQCFRSWAKSRQALQPQDDYYQCEDTQTGDLVHTSLPESAGALV
jgi:hypothetical protein